MIRALIIDDEAPARVRMRRLIAAHADLEVVAEAVNGIEALEVIQAYKPDAIFLDIEMPELDGLGVAASLPPGGPAIVFVTAYDEYALKAFELCAIDYLVKPVTEARLENVVQKLRRIQQRTAPANESLSALLQKLQVDQAVHRRFAVRTGAKFIVVDPGKISAVIARDHYSAILIDGRELLVDDPLDVVASRLNSQQFIRVHRSSIVNIDYLRELEREGDRKYSAILSDPARTRVPISRDRLDDVKGRLGV